MSSLTLHLLIDEQATAEKWTAIISRYLRQLADQLDAAPGRSRLPRTGLIWRHGSSTRKAARRGR